MTTNRNYTIMRPLAMEFRTDVRAANVGDQFMFGPAFLVNPVTEPASESRSLYLPKAEWYDFWTGRMIDGGQRITAEAPLERLPIYVRSGSIVPMGPNVEWTGQAPADTLELRIYKGANGEFSLYEDEGDNYDYEKGIYSVIPFHWDEMKQELTIGDRVGQFPGMLESRTIRMVFVADGHGIGVDPTDKYDTLVTYSGKTMIIPK
jgi:alpha-D-xyloside xylohydrolase